MVKIIKKPKLMAIVGQAFISDPNQGQPPDMVELLVG